MMETDKRPGFRASMYTDYMTFNQSCIELYYSVLGDGNTQMSVQLIGEDRTIILQYDRYVRFVFSTFFCLFYDSFSIFLIVHTGF